MIVEEGIGSLKRQAFWVQLILDIPRLGAILGMYAKAREGKLENFTGIDDPHEAPEHAELNFELTEANAKNIIDLLTAQGFLRQTPLIGHFAGPVIGSS